jgi:LDH2 family malate/lactate/ureidoglycolate dehydrogenase
MTTMTRVIHAGGLRHFCEAVLRRADVSQPDATTIADAMVEADLRGVRSHGVVLLPYYFDRLLGAGLNPRPDLSILQETPHFALLDGDNGMGHLAGVRAMTIAIEKAKAQGMAAVGVRNTSHYGAGAYYPMMALEYDLIGLATCNTAPSMAPWGGTTPTVGNNPLTVAIPAGEETPIVLDMAMSVVAFGKILLALRQGKKIPLGWGLTPQGEPTEDPSSVFPYGSLVPFGGHKGLGLAVVMEVLSGVLTGAVFGTDLELADGPDVPERIGHFYAALAMSAFIPLPEAKRGVDRLIRQVKSSGKASGINRIYLPGEIEAETKARSLEHGIRFEGGVVAELEKLASRLDLRIGWEEAS